MTIQLYITQYGFKYYYLKNTQDSNSMAYSIYNQKLILFLLLPVMIPVEPPPLLTKLLHRHLHYVHYQSLYPIIYK